MLVDADRPDKPTSACPSPGKGPEWRRGELIVKLFRSHGVRTSYSAINRAAKQLPPDKARRVMRQIEKTERDTGLSWAIPSGEAEETEYGEEALILSSSLAAKIRGTTLSAPSMRFWRSSNARLNNRLTFQRFCAQS